MAVVAVLCPGQGSQRVGMGKDLVERFPDIARPIFEIADDVLGRPLSTLCFEGPAEELRRTEVTQPAVFLLSHILRQVTGSRPPYPDVVAGHSLGEYAALTMAGVLEWTDALSLVTRRGELMARVNEQTPGAMLAVVGVPADEVESACTRAAEESGEVVEVANYNADTQTVISGTVGGCGHFRQVIGPLSDESKIVSLDVGAPFHSSLMADVEAEFGPALDAVEFRDPSRIFVSSVDAAVIESGADARAALKRQLVGPVRWRATMSAVVAEGVDTFVEMGPGRVLTGICRRLYPDRETYSVSDARRAEKFMSEFEVGVS